MKKNGATNCYLLRLLTAFILILIVVGLLTGCISGGPQWSIQDPYASVDWTRHHQYKANFHTHTSMSDGSGTPHAVIDRYRELGYAILSLTDHDTMSPEHATRPWLAFERDPEAIGMVAVEGSEILHKHHIGSYFNDYSDPSIDSEDVAIEEIGRRSGLSVLFHPGRYNMPVDWYTGMYRIYPHLIGIEIYNQGDRYFGDRKTWDAILTEIATERPVWGFSNDDMHDPKTQLGHNWNIMLLPELSSEWVRRGMMNGMFFFVYAPLGHDGPIPPVIRSITVNSQKGTIHIDVPDYESIEWISEGKVVHRGDRVSLSELPSLGGYIRAVIHAADSGSVVGTQPFRIQPLTK